MEDLRPDIPPYDEDPEPIRTLMIVLVIAGMAALVIFAAYMAASQFVMFDLIEYQKELIRL